MKKRMIKLMTIFCMAGILTVNPAIIGLAEEESAVGAEPVAEAFLPLPAQRLNRKYQCRKRKERR